MIRRTCHGFLAVLIVVSAWQAGHAFLGHRWDAAAGYGGLMLSASQALILLWAWYPTRAGRHTLDPTVRSGKR